MYMHVQRYMNQSLCVFIWLNRYQLSNYVHKQGVCSDKCLHKKISIVQIVPHTLQQHCTLQYNYNQSRPCTVAVVIIVASLHGRSAWQHIASRSLEDAQYILQFHFKLITGQSTMHSQEIFSQLMAVLTVSLLAKLAEK